MRDCSLGLGGFWHCAFWCSSGGSSLLMAGITTDLLASAIIACLDDPHEVSVIPLLLSLASPSGRVGDVLTVLGQDLHAGEMGEVCCPVS